MWFLLTLARLSMARSMRKTTGMAVVAGVLLLCGLSNSFVPGPLRRSAAPLAAASAASMMALFSKPQTPKSLNPNP